jgi:hypothetical protein
METKLDPRMEALIVETLSEPIAPPVFSVKRLLPLVYADAEKQGRRLEPEHATRLATVAHGLMLALRAMHRQQWKAATA